MVAVRIVAALTGPVVAAAEPGCDALVRELKRALTGYLTPLAGI